MQSINTNSHSYFWLKFLPFFLLVTKISATGNLCQTPEGKSGICKPISRCQSLYHLFKNEPKSSSEFDYVRRAFCRYEEKDPNACCRSSEIPSKSRTPFVNSTLLPDSETCGRSPENKIYGGNATNLDEFPWMALLDYEDMYGSSSFQCGGALINKRYILTAAHCIKSELVRVVLGEYDTSKEVDCIGKTCAPQPKIIPIEEMIPFPAYDFNTKLSYHDIALLRLKEEVEYSPYIKPICLPTTIDELFNSHVEEEMTVAGWGSTENGLPSNIKLKVDVPGINCRRITSRWVDAGQVCAGGVEGKDSCKGDSGGPLMSLQLVDEDAQYYAVGVLSYGNEDCGKRNKPAVYTKVAKYMYWIIDNLKP